MSAQNPDAAPITLDEALRRIAAARMLCDLEADPDSIREALDGEVFMTG